VRLSRVARVLIMKGEENGGGGARAGEGEDGRRRSGTRKGGRSGTFPFTFSRDACIIEGDVRCGVRGTRQPRHMFLM